jgi:hypothetical protein
VTVPHGTISVSSALTLTGPGACTYAKAVVKRTETIYSQATVDDASGNPVPVSCNTSSAAIDCAQFSEHTCYSNQCVFTSYVSTIFYIENFVPTATSTVSVPCDGGQYTIEVYGSSSGAGTAASPYRIAESYLSTPFVMPSSCNAPSSIFPAVPNATDPTLVVPTIYVAGLPGQTTYSVKVQGLKYPWATSWAVTATDPTPTPPTNYVATIAGNSATLNSPPNTDPLSIAATFTLDPSLGEVWTRQPTSVTQTPTAFGGVPVP